MCMIRGSDVGCSSYLLKYFFNKVHLFALQVFVLLEAMDVFSVMLIDLSYKSQVE